MSERGQTLYWNKQRLSALMKLGKAADQKRQKGKLNWKYASEKLPAQRKILKDKENHQLSKAYSTYRKVEKGKCSAAGCNNKRDTAALNCKKCREKMKKYANQTGTRVFYKYSINENIDLVEKYVRKKSKDELVDFIIDNFYNLSLTAREKILSKAFKKKVLKQIVN